MRIAIISPNRDAWSETFIVDIIRGLVGEKHVLIDGHLPRRHADGSPILGNSLVERIRRTFAVRVLGRTMDQVLEDRIVGWLREKQIQVVLAEYGPTGVAMLPLCKRAGIPMVVHFHGVDAWHKGMLAKYEAAYRPMLREAAGVVAVSLEMVDHLAAMGAPRERLHHISCGVDTTRFTMGAPATAPPVFLAAGRFVDKKGPALTLLAFNELAKEEATAHLVLVGDGPLLETCRRLCTAFGLDDRVTFTGALPHEQVRLRMLQARAFVQHSIATTENDREGTPVSVLEAMASGLAVIATRHAGIKDAISHEVNGLLCDEGDVRTMAVNMRAVLRDPALATRLGIAARARVQEAYAQRITIGALQQVLEEAAGIAK